MNARSSRGDIVIGWLVKLLASISIVGLVAFEAGAVIVTRVTAESTAGDIATEAAFAVGHGGGTQDAEDAARTEAAKHGVALVALSVSPERDTVSVTIEKTAKTLILQRLSWTKSWTVVRITRTRPAGP